MSDTKTCTRCRETKPRSEFGPTGGKCRPCRLQTRRESYDQNRESERRRIYAQSIKKLYGMTIEEHEAMWEAQGQRCKICRSEVDTAKRRMHVDHCHQTGRVRGLLCADCNRMLGGAKDSPEILEKAIAYLRG